MKLRVFDIIKSFEEDFTFNIHQSFEEAAALAESKEIEKQQKFEAAQKKANQFQEQKGQEGHQSINPRGQSIAFNTLVGLKPRDLTQKVQNIRDSSAIRPSYYPFQEGLAKKAPPKQTANPTNMPLEMVLLKNQVGG